MATQRYISTSFWDDEWIQTLDPSEKLLYLYLMTNPLTNIAGVYKITDRRIGFDTGFNLDTVKTILSKFEAKDKAFRFNEYIAIPSWPKHQEWEKRQKIRDGIVSELQNLPDDVIEFLDEIDYQFDLSLIEKIIIARKQRKGISGTTVKKLRIKYENKCAKCGGSGDLQIHHIVPIKEGGDNSFDNLTLLCTKCHKIEHQSNKVQIGYVDNFGHESQSTLVHNYSDLDLDLDRDIDKDNKRERGERSGERTNQTNQRFAKPSLEQLALYASSISYSRFDAQRFFDFYESKGWVVGKSPMKDWKAAVRNWRKRDDITQRDGNDRFVGQESADTTQEMMG